MACRCGSSLMLRSLLARASFIGAQLGVRGSGLYCGVRAALVAWAAAAAPGLPHELGPASVSACCCIPGHAQQALYERACRTLGPANGGAHGAAQQLGLERADWGCDVGGLGALLSVLSAECCGGHGSRGWPSGCKHWA